MALTGAPVALWADVFSVNTTTGSGVGSLAWAITQANSDPTRTDSIVFDVSVLNQTIVLDGNLPVINKAGGSLDISGFGGPFMTVSGEGQFAGFFVEAGDVTISGMTIQDMVATGGQGGDGTGAGGGGLGAGAGLFVNKDANVTLSSINFVDNTAQGGQGGNYQSGVSGGGGGGFRGDGGGQTYTGHGSEVGGGGGGFAGHGGAGQEYTNLGAGGGGQYGDGASTGAGGQQYVAGIGPGTGAAGAIYVGGDGANGNTGPATGGDGGAFGGGGGGAGIDVGTQTSGLGGNGGDFGGGGGGAFMPGAWANNTPVTLSGHGGFGGGGGGVAYNTVTTEGGFGGGDGGNNVTKAGGGAGLGGAVFVREGGTITFGDHVSFSGGNQVTGGLAGTHFSDQSNRDGSAAGSGMYLMNGVNANFAANTGITTTVQDDIAGEGGLVKNNNNVLILSGTNSYSGGTTVNAGSLIGTTDSLQGTIDTTYGAAVEFNQNTNGTFQGEVTGGGALVKSGTGTVTLVNENTHTDHTYLNEGTLAISHGNQLGDTSHGGRVVLGNATLQANAWLTINREIEIANSGHGTINTDINQVAVNQGLTGYGDLHKIGTGSLVLNAQANAYSGNVSVLGGHVLLGANDALGTGVLTLDGGSLGAIVNTTVSNDIVIGSNGGMIGTIASFMNLNGTVSGSGEVLINSIPGATVYTNQTHTTTGGWRVASGTLSLGNQASLGTGDLTLAGGTLHLYDATTLNNNLVLDSLSQVRVNSHDLAWIESGTISGTGALNVGGGGSLVLGHSTVGSYTGGVSVDLGTSLTGNTGNILGDVSNNGTLTFEQAFGTPDLFAGAISGTGSLVKTGIGSLHLTGTNTYTGGTIVGGGQLVGNTDSLGGAIQVNIGSSLALNQDTDGTFGGSFSGGGTIVKEGTGTVTLTQSSTHYGDVAINEGTLAISDSSQLGSGSVYLGGTLTATQSLHLNNQIEVHSDGGTVTAASGATLDLGGTVSGDGNLTVNSAADGIVSTNSVHTNTGGWTVAGGTLAVGSYGSLGTGEVTIDGGDLSLATSATLNNSIVLGTGGGAIRVAPNGQATLNGATISGSGTLNVQGTGFLALGTNTTGTYTGGVSVASGASVSGNTGNLVGDIANDGAVYLSDLGDATYSGDMSGTGSLQKFGVGTLHMTGTNTYAGGTTVWQGGISGNTDSLQGDIATFSGTIVTFDQDTDGTHSGAITGSGSLVKEGLGTLHLTGNNIYTGVTVVNAGTLSGAAGSFGTVVANQANITFDQAGDSSYSGSIVGTGSLTKTGTGSVNLTGFQSYTGDTTIDEGRLAINGVISSDVIVNQDGTLGGSGTINGDVTSTGTIAAGNSIGTLNVAGDLAINGGSMDVEIEAAMTPIAGVHNDLVTVTGTTTITGGTVNVAGGTGVYTHKSVYTFLTSTGGVNGQFDGVTDDLTGFRARLIYDPYAVSFMLLDSSQGFAQLAQTYNQLAVGEYLDFNEPTTTGDLDSIYNQLWMMSDDNIRTAMTQMGGEIYPTLATAGLQNTSFHLSSLRNGLALHELAYGEDNVAAWTRGYGLGGSTSSDGNAAGFTNTLGGTEIVVQKRLGDGVTVGGFGNAGWANIRLRGVDQQGQIESYLGGVTAQHIGPYGYQLAILGGGYQDHDVRRTIDVGGLNRSTRSSFGGRQGFAYLEQGTGFEAKGFFFQPYAALQYIHLRQDGLLETGADSINIAGTAVEADSLRSFVGISLGYPGLSPTRWITPTLRAAWMHEYLDTAQSFEGSFAGGQPGSSFIVRGNDLGRDWALTGIGLRAAVGPHLNVFTGYDNQFNGRQFFHTGTAGVEAIW